MTNNNSVNNLFLNQPVTTTSTNYTALPSDVIIEVTNTSAVRTITLPAPSTTGNVGKAFVIKDTSGGAGTNNITITPTSGLIDGQASASISSNYGSVQVFCDGTAYYTYGSSSASNSGSALTVVKRVFTATGTYTPTFGMLYCEVEAIGGGGGGGGAASPGAGQYTGGGGGGGGEYAYGVFSATQIGTSQAITIGAAGSSGSGVAGGAGGATSVGSLLSSNGGAGGATAAAAGSFNIPGALGGTGGTGGNYRFPGEVGGNSSGAFSASLLFGGIGGNSAKGAGGNEGTQTSGSAGLGYGAGGGGGAQSTAAPAVSGGAGAPGGVFITEYIATSTASLPVIALGQASWSRQSSVAFTPGATVVQTSFSSDPGSSPSNAASRLDLSGLTLNIGTGITISQFQVTIAQAGVYQVIVNGGILWSGSVNNAITQIVKNGTTVLGMASQQTQSGSPLESTGANYTGSFVVGDTIDIRYNTEQGSIFNFWDISLSIVQLPTSVVVPISTWVPVPSTSLGLASSTNYYTQNAAVTTLTLPISSSAGTTIQIAGVGAGGWVLAQNAGQSINFGNQVTTTGTGGSIASSNRYDGITILCVVENTQWVVLSAVGNLTVT